MTKLTKTQLAQFKKRYMAEGYKMAKKKMIKEYYTEDGEQYFEEEEANEFRRRLNEINQIFEYCLEYSEAKDYVEADSAYQQLVSELEEALRFLQDN